MTTTQVQKKQGTAPTGLTANAVAAGGTFAAGAQFWKVTANGPWGESAASAEATATLALNGHADLAWVNPPGTTSVNIYRGTTTNTENKLVASLSGSPQTWSDTGPAGSSVSPPANTTWSAATKTGTLPAKSNVQGLGLPPGLQNIAYAGLVGWCNGLYPNGGTGQLRNRKYLLAAGLDVQEV